MTDERPPCPKCGSRPRVGGKTSKGATRWRCMNKDCGKTWSKTKLGRPTIGKRSMTDAERKQRQRFKARLGE